MVIVSHCDFCMFVCEPAFQCGLILAILWTEQTWKKFS